MATEYVDAGSAIPYATLSTSVGKAPPVAKGVNYDRILNARDEPQNWLTYYGAYNGQRYSPLDQINASNVGQLTPQWVFQAGNVGLRPGATTYAWEASPIIVDGVMYVSGWDGQLWALDATNGQELWRYRHASPFDVSLCCGNVNRGVAVAEGKVFMTTLNAHIIALDAETGKKIWDKPFGDVRAGESATVAPLVVKDMVIVGSSGGEFGVRGHTDAFNRETGEHVWRCYMIPKPGEPGSETWPADGEAWQRGGANCWITPHLRPGPEPPLLRDRQSVSRLRRRGPRGRQPVHRFRCRRGRRQRRDQGALPVHPARPVGLRLRDGAPPVRPRWAEAGRPLRQERVPLHPGSHGHVRRSGWCRSSTASTGARSTRRAT